ncbi:penicillin-binding protein 1C [Chitinimonas sp.]|uniref:penicillin-binding protein 1C n=1 Tax=Chitinimonas sp. TaxID=1934313 RepID=UPI002F959B87
MPLLAGLALLSAPGTARAADAPDFAAVKAAYRTSDWLVADRTGAPLQTVRHDYGVRRLPWVALDEVSPTLQVALVTAEDQRFWEHGGVDWAALAQAAWSNQQGGQTVRGASTLTMQLAGLLDPALRAAPGSRRNLGQKWDQALAARSIEKTWSKRQILEAYLNLMPLRGEASGLRAASQLWFGKAPDGLDWTEAVLLSALVRQPQANAERVAERACGIALALDEEQLGAGNRPDCRSVRARAMIALGDKPGYGRVPGQELAPHLARKAIEAWGKRPAPLANPAGMPVLRTTLDARIQRLAVESLTAHLRELRKQNVEDGAAIVLDNATGEVVAWVGSSGLISDAPQVDGVLAPRQAGSTLKPFLYGLALEQRRLTAASLLHDSPLALTAANGAYVPQNYDRQFKGWVSARTALASSLNVPAVRTLLLTGVEPFYQRLKLLGLDTLDKPADHYGFGLALGGADVRLLDLANAYRALANGGQWSPVAPLLPGEPRPAGEGRRALSPAAAFVVGDILSDRGARAPTFDLENTLATRVWSAVKTGTSKDMRDNWCMGYTRRYTVGVWVGNFSGEPMWDVSGMHGAAPVWRDLVQALQEADPGQPPKAPAGVVASMVHFKGVQEAARREWFVRGTETQEIARADQAADESAAPAPPRIQYPGNGLVIALDPDLPPAVERVVLRSEPSDPRYRWQLERSLPSPCRQTLPAGSAWAPQPGSWTLKLLDGEGQQVANAVRFSVRGSTRRALECDAVPAAVGAP